MQTDRNRLIQQHLPLVQGIAAKLKRTLGRSIETEDLAAYGSRGLIEAADRFDPRHGASFSTFAYYRIRGAMVDGLRTMGWYSRADFARYRAEERTNEYLQNLSEREAAQPAADGAPGAARALESVAEVLGGVAAVHIVALEAASSVADDRLAGADEALEKNESDSRVRRALGKLPDKERRLMELYYFGDKNLTEAGAALGLSKSWACRLHARAVGLLREGLASEGLSAG
jgi:RNA polymerase sigma factor for flagellar operon FliA